MVSLVSVDLLRWLPDWSSLAAIVPSQRMRKKASVMEHPKVFDHAGLLFNEPPGTAGLPFI